METNSSKTLQSVTCSLPKEPAPKIIFLEDKKKLIKSSVQPTTAQIGNATQDAQAVHKNTKSIIRYLIPYFHWWLVV